MSAQESLLQFFRRKRTSEPFGPAVVRRSDDGQWEVIYGMRLLARFSVGERMNAVDFANGFNLGRRYG